MVMCRVQNLEEQSKYYNHDNSLPLTTFTYHTFTDYKQLIKSLDMLKYDYGYRFMEIIESN